MSDDIKILKPGRTYIYTLSNPNDGEVRYVGKTDDIENRLKEHIRKHMYKTTYKNNWIKSLKKIGLTPKIEILDTVSSNEWCFWEKYWISQFKVWGFNLTNSTNGGEGGNLGELVNKKISEKLKGRVFSKETILKMSKSKTGLKHSEETKLKMSEHHKGVQNGMYGKKPSSNFYKKVNKAIIQLSLDDNFIKNWGSIIIASRTLNINRCTIADVCNKRKYKKTAGGFKWKFKG